MKTNRQKPARIYVDWDIPLHQMATVVRPANGPQLRLHEMLYPLAEDYLSPVPAIFLHRLPSLDLISGKAVTIARDGAIPLVHFFRKFPSPKGLVGKIAVHEDLLSWIPPAWRVAVASYRLVSTQKGAAIDSVFIYGTNSSALISPSSCEKALAGSAKILSRVKKLYLFLPSFFFARSEPIQMHAEIARRVFATIGTRVEVIDWGRFLQNPSLSGCHIVNLMKKTVISDPWLTHSLMRLGATISARSPKGDEDLFPLSRAHGIAVQKNPKFPALPAARLRNEEEALLSSYEATVIDWALIFSGSSEELHAEHPCEAPSPSPLKNLSHMSGF